MDFYAIGWTALLGGVAGGVGALIGLLLAQMFGGGKNPGLVGGIAGGCAVAAGILAQHVTPQMVGDLVGIDAFNELVDNQARAAIERELDALPPE